MFACEWWKTEPTSNSRSGPLLLDQRVPEDVSEIRNVASKGFEGIRHESSIARPQRGRRCVAGAGHSAGQRLSQRDCALAWNKSGLAHRDFSAVMVAQSEAVAIAAHVERRRGLTVGGALSLDGDVLALSAGVAGMSAVATGGDADDAAGADDADGTTAIVGASTGAPAPVDPPAGTAT